MKKIKISLIIAAAAFCFAACHSNDEQAQQQESQSTIDSINTEDATDLQKDAQNVIDQRLPQWLAYKKQQNDSFSVSNFEFVAEDTLSLMPGEKVDSTAKGKNWQQYLQKYSPYLSFSPDSSYAIDLFSYNILLEKDSHGDLKALTGDPDMQASLVNLKDKTRQRLLFVGPSSGFDDAVWTSPKTLYIVGKTKQDNDSTQIPVIWEYHLDNKVLRTYQYSEPIELKDDDYLDKVKFKGKILL